MLHSLLQLNEPKQVPDSVAKEIDRVSKELDRMKAVQAVQTLASQNRGQQQQQPRMRLMGSTEDEERVFWNARKKIRCFPVPGRTQDELWHNTEQFFLNVLAIPEGELPPGAVLDVSRVHVGRRKNAIGDEVVISFDNITSRDIVSSYAPNLADYRRNNGGKAAGIRLEIPDHLRGVFRTLDRHGHTLKDRHGVGLRRNIKYNDTDMTLVMDACLPDSSDWFRVSYEDAVSEHRQRSRTITSNLEDGSSPQPATDTPTFPSTPMEGGTSQDGTMPSTSSAAPRQGQAFSRRGCGTEQDNQ